MQEDEFFVCLFVFDHKSLFDSCIEIIKERNRKETVGGGNKGKRKQRGKEEFGRSQGERVREGGRQRNIHLL